MSFISTLASLASNTPLARLAPANRDAIKDSMIKASVHSKSSKIYRDANQQGRVSTDTGFRERAEDSLAKADEYEKHNSETGRGTTRALKQQADAITRVSVMQNHQKALGREANSGLADGSVLNADQLKTFRESNNSIIKEHQKGSQKARKELAGHAKGYFLSGDMGTNAMRWGAVGAAYGAANVGVRTLSGGSATTNNQGQRDIAGIPFL